MRFSYNNINNDIIITILEIAWPSGFVRATSETRDEGALLFQDIAFMSDFWIIKLHVFGTKLCSF